MMVRLIKKKNAQELDVLDTEASRPKLKMEELAKCGTANLHRDINKLEIRFNSLVWRKTTAETQIMEKLSGAIPLIKRRDGNIALQLLRLIEKKSAQEEDVKNTEAARLKLEAEKLAKHGINKLHINISKQETRLQNTV